MGFLCCAATSKQPLQLQICLEKRHYHEKPLSRIYAYNLDVGENYFTESKYLPLFHLETQPRVEAWDEKLVYQHLNRFGHRYDQLDTRGRYSRAFTLTGGPSGVLGRYYYGI